MYILQFQNSPFFIQDDEAVAVLAGCCHDWIQSVEKVLTDIQNASTQGLSIVYVLFCYSEFLIINISKILVNHPLLKLKFESNVPLLK